MSIVTFYEKPGCISNTRQKRLLKDSGHLLKVRNLLEHPWTAESLRPFFGQLTVSAWFNPTAPRVKSGEVKPDQLSEDEALEIMMADPILIRRPLMEVDGQCRCGFDQVEVDHWLGLVLPETEVTDNCPRVGGRNHVDPPLPARTSGTSYGSS